MIKREQSLFDTLAESASPTATSSGFDQLVADASSSLSAADRLVVERAVDHYIKDYEHAKSIGAPVATLTDLASAHLEMASPTLRRAFCVIAMSRINTRT